MKILRESVSAKVGPFYVIGSRIISASESLRDVHEVGEFKDSSNSHYQLWKALQRSNSSLRRFDYDYMPRGRVTFNCNKRIFYIIIDKDINEEDVRNIADKFGIPNGQYEVKYDEHYQCHLCNKNYVNITESR